MNLDGLREAVDETRPSPWTHIVVPMGWWDRMPLLKRLMMRDLAKSVGAEVVVSPHAPPDQVYLLDADEIYFK